MWFLKKDKLGNKDEALELLETEHNQRRSMPYPELLEWIENDTKQTYEIVGKSGINYQLAFFAIWDDKKAKTIRLWGNIDGGDISAYRPLSSTYIKTSDETFIGE